VRSPIRRFLPLALVIVFMMWIIFIIVMITVNPTAGSGNPMD
jgi:hypothetical protein